ncbi:MAG: hypothetical protein ACREUP_01090 [Burkholderiales bacterium]
MAEKTEAGQKAFITRRGRPAAKRVRAKWRKEQVEPGRSTLIDEISTFSKTCKVGRVNLRKLIAEGRD